MVPTWHISIEYLDSKYADSEDSEPPYTATSSRAANRNQFDPDKVIDAEITKPLVDDEVGMALLTNPVIQMQSQRIKELEKDRKRDGETIETLTKTLSLLEELIRKNDESTKYSSTSAAKEDAPGDKAEAPRKPKSTPTSKTKKSTRKARNAKPRKTTPKKPKHWLHRPISELFLRG